MKTKAQIAEENAVKLKRVEEGAAETRFVPANCRS